VFFVIGRGITKAAIAKLSAGTEFPLYEQKLPAIQLTKATECFATSATREVMPVAAIRLEGGEWREFPPGGGEVTRRVAEAYKDFVSHYVGDNESLRLL
jgi:branched-subunit amino acid aminotransferase/4-amino-4-deoxychorismate lyase